MTNLANFLPFAALDILTSVGRQIGACPQMTTGYNPIPSADGESTSVTAEVF